MVNRISCSDSTSSLEFTISVDLGLSPSAGDKPTVQLKIKDMGPTGEDGVWVVMACHNAQTGHRR